MNITITGGSGFLGRKLAERLLGANELNKEDGVSSPVENLILLDVTEPPEDLKNDPRVTILTGILQIELYWRRQFRSPPIVFFTWRQL